VRVRAAGEQAWLTIKGLTINLTRLEYEYEIPVADARYMLEHLCQQPIIDKTRYAVHYAGHRWDVDEFHGANEGLRVAEIELRSEDETFERPPWLGAEVSGDARYYNARLVQHPYRDW
jgi:adenylate cyclase